MIFTHVFTFFCTYSTPVFQTQREMPSHTHLQGRRVLGPGTDLMRRVFHTQVSVIWALGLQSRLTCRWDFSSSALQAKQNPPKRKVCLFFKTPSPTLQNPLLFSNVLVIFILAFLEMWAYFILILLWLEGLSEVLQSRRWELLVCAPHLARGSSGWSRSSCVS